MGRGKSGKFTQGGTPGNPDGRPPLPAEVRALLERRKSEIKTFIGAALVMPKKEAKTFLKLDSVPMVHQAIVRFISKVQEGGDEKRMRLLLELAIDLKNKSEAPPPGFVPLVPLTGDQLTKALDALKSLKEKK